METTTSHTAESAPELGYAPRLPWHSRRWRRWLVPLLFLLLAIVVAYLWRIEIRDRVTHLYNQRQCATDVAPKERVVYERDPARAAALMAADRSYRRTGGWTV